MRPEITDKTQNRNVVILDHQIVRSFLLGTGVLGGILICGPRI